VTDAPTARLDPVDGEWRRISPKYIVVDLVGTFLGGLIPVAALVVAWWIFELPEWLLVVPAAVAVITLITLAVTPRRVRSIGYQLREDDLLFRRGILQLRIIAVPYGRMQLVDITRGPIARAVGLSELKLVTAAAASNITIPGLLAADAEALRDHLVEVAETRRAGL